MTVLGLSSLYDGVEHAKGPRALLFGGFFAT
jgi:hypothetical protein